LGRNPFSIRLKLPKRKVKAKKRYFLKGTRENVNSLFYLTLSFFPQNFPKGKGQRAQKKGRGRKIWGGIYTRDIFGKFSGGFPKIFKFTGEIFKIFGGKVFFKTNFPRNLWRFNRGGKTPFLIFFSFTEQKKGFFFRISPL